MKGMVGQVAFVIAILLGVPGECVYAAVDLAIGFDQKTSRPNLFIAWRNTERILEVELEIKNYGDEQGSGSLSVAILDEEGRVIQRSPGSASAPISVTLPPSERGGREGKIVQMHGSKELNLLIDRLDRANARYSLQAEITTSGSDANLVNNVALKTFNINARLRPSGTHFFDYYFVNTTEKPLRLAWKIETSVVPANWRLETYPRDGERVTLAPGEVIQGHATLVTPAELVEGEHLDVRFTALTEPGGGVFGKSEWFTVYDTTPPAISGLAYEVDQETGIVEVVLTADDPVSMLKEASGVRLEYSTDGGITFSNRVLAYLDGNFVGPTRFRGEVGPFAGETELAMGVIVSDIAGNSAKRLFEPIVIPPRACLTASGM